MTGTGSPVVELGTTRVLPVVTLDDADLAVPLVAALVDAGLTVVEITLRTDAALEAIRRVVDAAPGAIVGAGTTTSAGLARAALEAGARFLVSPGLDPDVIDEAADHGVLAIPGVATPTEVQRAVQLGCSTVKLFPAEIVGGTRLIEALSAVWPDVRFVPTGGISPANAATYLSLAPVLAVGGSWMVPRDSVVTRDWAAVTAAAAAAARLGTERS